MRRLSLSIAFSQTLALTSALTSGVAAAPPPGPQTVYWESAHFLATKQAMNVADPSLQKYFLLLRKNANRAAKRGPYSVMQKTELPPSGNKHDYVSYGRYWWPNPNTEDGLPYIRCDGKTNQEVRTQGDRKALDKCLDSVECLALAYYYFEDEKYARHASLLIRTWFLDAKTAMNPNMNFAQAVKGRSEGRGVGILDTRKFIILLDAVVLLRESPSFPQIDQLRLRQWFKEYLLWLNTSEQGKEEIIAKNNHGTWYAAQVARIAFEVGERDLARKVIETVRTVRIPDQFQADGSQPHETGRTKSLDYSMFNLSALAVIARVGEQLEIDLWHDRTGKQGNLQTGLKYLGPHLADQGEWPHEQMKEFLLTPQAIEFLRMASVRYSNPEYATVIKQVAHRYAKRNYAPLVSAALPGLKEK